MSDYSSIRWTPMLLEKGLTDAQTNKGKYINKLQLNDEIRVDLNKLYDIRVAHGMGCEYVFLDKKQRTLVSTDEIYRTTNLRTNQIRIQRAKDDIESAPVGALEWLDNLRRSSREMNHSLRLHVDHYATNQLKK